MVEDQRGYAILWLVGPLFKLLPLFGSLIFPCVVPAQALDRYPMIGASGGLGLPLRLAEPSSGVAKGVLSLSRGVNISVPLAKPVFGAKPELMLSGHFVDIISKFQFDTPTFARPGSYDYNLNPVLLANAALLWRLWSSKPQRFNRWSFKAGAIGGIRATIGREITSCYQLPTTFVSTDCSEGDPETYAYQRNYESFILNLGVASAFDYSFISKNGFFAGRLGLLLNYYPLKVDQFKTVVRHQFRPYDGLVRWNRSSSELFFQFHLNGKIIGEYLRNNKQRFEDEPRP